MAIIKEVLNGPRMFLFFTDDQNLQIHSKFIVSSIKLQNAWQSEDWFACDMQKLSLLAAN